MFSATKLRPVVEIPLVDLKAQFATIEDEIRAAVNRVLERQIFIHGPETEAFEGEFAQFAGAREAVTVANGTSALELALWSLGVGPGDEVITVSWTFWATTEAILRRGAVPIFVDVREDDWTMDAARVAEAVTARTKAVLPVHIFGHPADIPAIVAAAPGMLLIEDAAQAHGADYHGKAVGSDAAVATYSFYPAKNLGAYGDAGALTTNDQSLASLMRALRDHGRSTKYEHPLAGTNARCSEIQCAVLRAKLLHLRGWTDERRRLSALYEDRLAGLGLGWQTTQPWAHHVRHLFVVTHPDRQRLLDLLAADGIGASVHYPVPVHRQEGLRSQEWRSAGSLEVTEALAKRVLSLPLYPELGDDGVERVCTALEKGLEKIPA